MALNKSVRRARRVSGWTVARIAAAGCLALAVAAPASGASLLPDGAFTLGLTGFSSGYVYNDDCWGEGSYFIAGSGADCHSLWSDFGDHTTGDGSMMVVNGARVSGVEVWALEPGKTVQW